MSRLCRITRCPASQPQTPDCPACMLRLQNSHLKWPLPCEIKKHWKHVTVEKSAGIFLRLSFKRLLTQIHISALFHFSCALISKISSNTVSNNRVTLRSHAQPNLSTFQKEAAVSLSFSRHPSIIWPALCCACTYIIHTLMQGQFRLSSRPKHACVLNCGRKPTQTWVSQGQLLVVKQQC